MPASTNRVEVLRAAKNGNLRVLHQFVHTRRSDGTDDVLDPVTRSTALHYAAEANNASTVLMLIRAGIYIDAQNADGQTAMHLAAANSSYSAIRVLVRNRADLNTMDHRGLTPLEVALQCGDPEGTTNAILEAARGRGVGRSTDRQPSVDHAGMPILTSDVGDDQEGFSGSPLQYHRQGASSPGQVISAPAGGSPVRRRATSPQSSPHGIPRRVFGGNLPSASPSPPQVVVQALQPPAAAAPLRPHFFTQGAVALATSSIGSSSCSSADSKTTTLLGTVNTGIPKPSDDCLTEALQCPIDFGFYNLLTKKPCVLVCCGKSVCHQCLLQVKRCPFCNADFQTRNSGAGKAVVFNRSLMELLRR